MQTAMIWRRRTRSVTPSLLRERICCLNVQIQLNLPVLQVVTRSACVLMIVPVVKVMTSARLIARQTVTILPRRKESVTPTLPVCLFCLNCSKIAKEVNFFKF